MQTKNKITNLRTCIYSNKQYSKDQLLRLIKKNNRLEIDKEQNKSGRGYYLYITKEMLNDEKLISLISKKTRCIVDQKWIEELKQYEKND